MLKNPLGTKDIFCRQNVTANSRKVYSASLVGISAGNCGVRIRKDWNSEGDEEQIKSGRTAWEVFCLTNPQQQQ
jgi:hypothetical protein